LNKQTPATATPTLNRTSPPSTESFKKPRFDQGHFASRLEKYKNTTLECYFKQIVDAVLSPFDQVKDQIFVDKQLEYLNQLLSVMDYKDKKITNVIIF
jgi:hypothetical protein